MATKTYENRPKMPVILRGRYWDRTSAGTELWDASSGAIAAMVLQGWLARHLPENPGPRSAGRLDPGLPIPRPPAGEVAKMPLRDFLEIIYYDETNALAPLVRSA